MLDAWGWCTGTTQRDGMGREEGGGFRMGNNNNKKRDRIIEPTKTSEIIVPKLLFSAGCLCKVYLTLKRFHSTKA